jgi:hypothetical protein
MEETMNKRLELINKKEMIISLEIDNNGNHFKVVDGKYYYVSESEYNSLKESKNERKSNVY